MLELYGRQWEISYGHVDGVVFPVWRDGLAQHTPLEIKAGLDAVIAEGNEFPPNLIKFLRLCRNAKPLPIHQPAKLLPPPIQTEAIMAAALAKCRQMFGMQCKLFRKQA